MIGLFLVIMPTCKFKYLIITIRSIIILSLLMPKVIQPRRHDKTLDVQEFWNIRNLAKKTQVASAPRPYKEEEVAQRHRYKKPSEQAKTFNPLALLLRRERNSDMNDLYQIGGEDENTHVAQYLSQVQYRVTSGIVAIKKLVMGRKSIVHNSPKILNILLQHLDYEDTWLLLQAVLKDTPEVDIKFWLDEGLRRLVDGISGTIGTNFNQIVFRNFFDTLCVFMQTYFDQISKKLTDFIESYSEALFNSKNKYVRKFAVQTFSYILTNIPEYQYHTLMNYLVDNQHTLFNQNVSLAQVLVQRLKIVKGCLSAASLTHFLGQLEMLAEIFEIQNQENRQQFNTLIEEYIGLVLAGLQNRQAAKDDQILFDFNYVLSALVSFCNKNKQTFGEGLLRGCSKFINLYKTDKKRFQPFNSYQGRYLSEMWSKFEQLFQQNQDYFSQSGQFFYALSVLIVKGSSAIYYDQNIINFSRKSSQFITYLLEVIYEEEQAINNSIVEVVLLLSKQLLKQYILGSSQSQLVYKLIIVLKRSGFSKLIQSSWIQLQNHQIMNRIVTAKHSCDLLVLLRLITMLRLVLNREYLQRLQSLKQQALGVYQKYLTKLLNSQTKHKNSAEQLYNFKAFSKEIIVFSHHQIGWLSHVFNLFEAFSQAFDHLQKLCGVTNNRLANSVWNELIVSRPSAVKILKKNGYLNQSFTNSKIALSLLSSRNRQVRWNTLQSLISHFSEESSVHNILSKLLFIDQDQIGLDNERQIKRYFCQLEQDIKCISNNQQPDRLILLEYLLQWSLGFAFTGFKLIESAFISFFAKLLDCNIVYAQKNTSVVSQQVMPFLEYYHYRHSRQYDYDIKQNNHVINAFQAQTDIVLAKYVKQDLQIAQVDTVEWIGLQRIAEAVKVSSHGKQNLGDRLKQLVQTYFSVQFNRRKNNIILGSENAEAEIPTSFTTPVKTRFLEVMLKLCPKQFVPPYQCLHFTREEFFDLPSIKNIKKNNWQTIWQKKKSNVAKKKIEVEEKASTTVNLEHLSYQEQEIYLHYLWKDILQNNRHKKRIIFDHIRTYLPTASQRILHIFFESLFIDDLLARKQDLVEPMSKRLGLMNRKQLLNYMFILKSMLIHMRQQISEGNMLQQIVVVIIAIIKVIYISQKDQILIGEAEEHENQPKEKQNQGEKLQDDQQQEKDDYNGQNEENAEEGKGQISDWLSYKQHRKELQKLLHTMFENHYLSVPLIQELLQFLLRHSKTNLSKSCRVSVPGFLLILNIVSQTKQYCQTLAELQNGQIVNMLAELITNDKNGARPLTACYKLWINILTNLVLTHPESMEDEKAEQNKIDEQIRQHSDSLLRGMLSYINGKESEQELKLRANVKNSQKKQSQDFLRFLRIADKLMKLQTAELQKQWQEFIWDELSKVAKTKKNFNAFQYEKLNLLISILSRYIQLKVGGLGIQSKRFIRRIIGLLPSIKDNQQRLTINQLISTHHSELGLSQNIVLLAANTSDLIKNALEITMNFPLFFQSCNKYNESLSKFTLVQHEYFLHNLLCYVDHQELSVRRAVSNSNKEFLTYVKGLLTDQILTEETKEENKQTAIELVLRAYRVQLDLLHKLPIQQNDSVFWSIVGNIGYYVNWIADCSSTITSICLQPNAQLYNLFVKGQPDQQDIFSLFTSISESNKLKALKLLRSILSNIHAQHKQKIISWETHHQIDIPHVITKAILPILEYLVIHPTEFIPNNSAPKSNLASSLALLSLEILPLLSSFLKQSSIKKQLKRLVSKLKFSEAENKKNIALIKMISQIIEGVEGERANEKLKGYLNEHGFQQFHNKIAQHATVKTDQEEDDDNQSAQVIGKKQKIPDFYDNLEQLEQEEAINRNFMRFDKKLMEIEEQNQEEGESDFNFFLRKQILLPLRTMLMLESKNKEQQEKSKSKVLLSVTITKVLLHLPMNTFLRQFQKVVGKLARLLKKRAVQVRQNARSCLCEIAKSVGPQLLYSIIMELRFNLKDNFDRHVFNYTVHRLLQVMELTQGQLDYCIPLVLPLVVDEIYGQSSQQKQLVQRGQVPTLKMEAKKRKGLELLQVLCRYISHHKINYIIQYLEKYLREHLITEENLGKYDQMLGSISSGLASNRLLIDPCNTPTLLPALSLPIAKLREQIKLLNWENKPINQNTVKNSWKKRKAGKDEVLTLQEEAGRNKSIFKKMTKQIGEKRNREIVASSLIQFYLVLLSLLIRKQVFTIKSTTQTLQMGHQMINLLSFLNQCVDHRDNRLVSKSLKILHLALGWNAGQLSQALQPIAQKFKSLKKQVSRKMMLMIQQLTLADQQLLKQCFVFLNDLISEVNIQPELLPSMTAIIKLHMPTTQDQPHIAETYKLLRTILIKGEQHIYNSLLDDLHKLVRLQLVTCHNKQIREISKNILSVYLRPRSDLEPRIEAHNMSQKKQGNKSFLTYDKVIKQQLTFYLSNLQSEAQQTVLQLLEQFIQNRDNSELQTFGQLILLSLMTARTNQVIAEVEINRIEAQHSVDKLVNLILKKLNQNKILNLVQKCLTWLQSQRLSTIRLCGASLLRMIIQLSSPNFNKNFINQYIVGQNGITPRISVIVQEQANEFHMNQTLMRKQNLGSKKGIKQEEKRENKEWNLVLDMMQVTSGHYQTDPSLTQLLHIFITLSKNDEVRRNLNPHLTRAIICSIWKLLPMKDIRLVELLIQALSLHKIVVALSQYESQGIRTFYDEKSQLSFKKTLSLLLFHEAKLQSLFKLVIQILTEQAAISSELPCLKILSDLLIILALKAHIKPLFAQRVLPSVISMLNQIVLSDYVNGINFSQHMFTEDYFQSKLIQITVKLSSNQLISYENKNLIQQTTQILKQKMGAADYFKAVGVFQTNRRERKEREKVQLAELAITDPQRFAQQKSRKKRKLQ